MKRKNIQEQSNSTWPPCTDSSSSWDVLVISGGTQKILTSKTSINNRKKILLKNNKTGLVIDNGFKVGSGAYLRGQKFKWECRGDGLKLIFDENASPPPPPPPPPPSELPDWVKNSCLNNYADALKKEDDVTVYEISRSKNKWEYWNDKKDFDGNPLPSNRFYFVYIYENGDVDRGTWGCENDKVYIEKTGSTGTVEYWREGEDMWKELVSSSSSSPPAPAPLTDECTPFTNKVEADEFRKWVKKNLPNIANNIPNMPSSVPDKKLSLRGPCNTIQIKRTAIHEIDGEDLISLFRQNKVPTIKEKPREVTELETLHKDGKIKDGKFIMKAQGKWAYLKEIEPVSEYPNFKHYLLIYPDGTYETFIDQGVGWWFEGKWEAEKNPESTSVPIKIVESTLMKEQTLSTSDPNKLKKSESSAIQQQNGTQTSNTANVQTNTSTSVDKSTQQTQTVPGGSQSTESTEELNDLYNNLLNGKAKDKKGITIPDITKFKEKGLFNPKDESTMTGSSDTYLTQSGLKNYCVILTKKTFKAFEKKYELQNQGQKKDIIEVLNKCKQHFRFSGRLSSMIDRLIYDKSLGLRENKNYINKKMENSLTNTVRKHLSEAKEEKKYKIIESSIIKFKLNEINYSGKTPRQISKILIEYSKFLNNKGFDNKLLGENLMDLIDVLYKDKSSNVKSTFNSEAANYICDELKLKSDSEMRSIIKDLFTSKSLDETVKLFNDCEYLCNNICDKISESMGFEDTSMKTSFSRNLNSEINSLICPMIKSMGDKMQKKFKDMKSKALS